MSSTSVLVESTPAWVELPREITATILHKLGPLDILMIAQMVCTTWWSVSQDAAMWRSIDIHDQYSHWEYDCGKLCRQAVYRSKGQLIDIRIVHYGTNDLLLYISERSNQLKSLRLLYCNAISDKGLIEAVKKLLLLEELELLFVSINDTKTIEVIGRSCPHLKSLKLNNCGYKRPRVEERDIDAFAIAENMHELRQLQLLGNEMTDKGLEAILDGCPHLESLDLSKCLNVQFDGNLAKLCSQRIKDLKRPNPYLYHYLYDVGYFVDK